MPNIMKVSIGKAAKVLGVSIQTLRRWEWEGKIQPERTLHGHRRYDLAKLQGLKPYQISQTERLTICYARISSSDQDEQLACQISTLECFCAENGWEYEIISDLGSGMDYNKIGLQELILRICSGDVGRLVLTHKDRLLRFGSELIFSLCEAFNTEVVIMNSSECPESFGEELSRDMLEIIMAFSVKAIGRNGYKNRIMIEAMREVAEQL